MTTTANNNKGIAVADRNKFSASVLAKVNDLQKNKALTLPPNYSAENALKSAWLVIQKTQDMSKNMALDVCTSDSVANALLDMVVQGLSVVKKQCYFIVYGQELVLQRSYFGAMAAAKRVADIIDIAAEVVRKGEPFAMTIHNGVRTVTQHEPSVDTMDNDIIAAYCIVTKRTNGGKDPTGAYRQAILVHTEFMTAQQVHQSWKQSKANPFTEDLKLKSGSVHYKFNDQMFKKTVINRACKYVINTSDDSDLLIEAINRNADVLTSDPDDGDGMVLGQASTTVINAKDLGVKKDAAAVKEDGGPAPAAADPLDAAAATVEAAEGDDTHEKVTPAAAPQAKEEAPRPVKPEEAQGALPGMEKKPRAWGGKK